MGKQTEVEPDRLAALWAVLWTALWGEALVFVNVCQCFSAFSPLSALSMFVRFLGVLQLALALLMVFQGALVIFE